MFKPISALYQTAAVRALDQIAVNEFNIPGIELMTKAGQAAFDLLQRMVPNDCQLLVLTGKGNNAGDGYVVARLAHSAGWQVQVAYLEPPANLVGDAKLAVEVATAAGVVMAPYAGLPEDDNLVVVDALLGTGLKGKVQAGYAAVIAELNQSELPVLALDVPSGLDADCGQPLGVAVQAIATITFAAAKIGLFTGQAADYCGEVVLADIGIPEEALAEVETIGEILDLYDLVDNLTCRSRASHKGNYGHVLVVGGDYGMAGATRLAGEAALRVGAGLTTVLTRPEHVTAVIAARPELMCRGINNSLQLTEYIEKSDAIVVGPGLGRQEWGRELWQQVVASEKPLIVDADALTFLAEKPIERSNWILTPHPGEAARLLSTTTDLVQQDRVTAVQRLQQQYGGTVILKGSGSLVLGESKPLGVCVAGNPGMASGGMGDVLSGVIAGLIAQGLELELAARMAVVLHAKAADIVAEEFGERGLLASDLFSQLRQLVNGAVEC